MNITVFGTGYVGLVTGTCLAAMGNDVMCIDVDTKKIERLENGEIPIYEPGLDSMVAENHKAGRLHFTTDAAKAMKHGEVLFIAVGTPPDEDGSADLSYVLNVASTIGKHLTKYAVVVDKSTVPVGTAERVHAAITATLAERNVNVDFDVVANPEFLKEGDAINDCMKPARIVIGTSSGRAADLMKTLYAPFNYNHDRILVMDTRSAELTKYAANAMLATKISFMNELANIAEAVGADIELIRHGIGTDPRIGYQFIYPGVGYGGSCFPKDVQALEHMARAHNYQAQLLQAVEAVNARQKMRLFDLMTAHFNGQLKGKTIALWGLAFKPNTDDMREAPSRQLMEALWKVGANVQAFDPQAMKEAWQIYGQRDDLTLCDSAESALEGADALVVVTEWKAFRSPDFAFVHAKLSTPVLFDGRNLYDPNVVENAGVVYYGIGRGRSLHASQRKN